MFEEYLKNQLDLSPLYTNKTKNTRESYKGIVKKDYPKWEGWKIIKSEKANGVHISSIENSTLETMVYNFYYIKYITSKY